MALAPNRGQPPGELSQTLIGAEAALIINLGNGRQPALVGLKAKGIPARPFQPLWWYLSSDPDGCTASVVVESKPHGSGSFTTVATIGLTSPATEDDGDASGWAGILTTDWIQARLSALSVGSPKQLSLTIIGEYV